ncbi:hypothetical protein [Bacillus sp. 2205SS5-2]|uniref:hypothetical protein n=1 Tax=Bacillus sp. 2205SS5-2 TaxID=3109031 RepID=UPI003007CD28
MGLFDSIYYQKKIEVSVRLLTLQNWWVSLLVQFSNHVKLITATLCQLEKQAPEINKICLYHFSFAGWATSVLTSVECYTNRSRVSGKVEYVEIENRLAGMIMFVYVFSSR